MLIRHILSILFFNLAQLYVVLTLLTWIFSDYISVNEINVWDNKWIGYSKILFASQGIYLPLLRLVEPYFFKVLKQNAVQVATLVFKCRKPLNKDELIDEDGMIDRDLFDELELKQLQKDSLGMLSTSDGRSNTELSFAHTINHADDDQPEDDDERSSNRITRATVARRVKQEESLSPMYVFLASSLNVELVYSILKGVTQFGYLTLCDPDEVAAKLSKMQTVSHGGDTTLVLSEIKIKNSQVWNKSSY